MIKIYDTNNNTYILGRISKTSYEQQQERRENFWYMFWQKVLAIGFIITMTIVAFILPDAGITVVLGWFIGLPLLITNRHVLG